MRLAPCLFGRMRWRNSFFEISANQYKKNKLAESPVLQPALTEDKQSAVRTLANFLRYDNSANKNIKSEIEKNQKKLRFSLKNGEYGLAHIEKRRGKKVKAKL